MKPSWRKPAGVFAILGIIVVWAVLVTTVARFISSMSWPVQLAFYVVAGIVWILPLKPLLQWMETGTWRPPEGL